MEYRVIFLALLAFCSVTRAERDSRKETMMETMPAYTIARTAMDVLNGTVCRKDLEVFLDATNKKLIWALKLLDASGEPSSGFMYGNNFWLGSRNQCNDLGNPRVFMISQKDLRNNSRYRKEEEEHLPFKVNFFTAFFVTNTTRQYHINFPGDNTITLGLCLPASCNTADIRKTLEAIFRERILLQGDLFSGDFHLIDVRDPRTNYEWLLQGRFILLGIFILFTIIMMVVGTTYDVLVHQKRLKSKQKFPVCENNNTSEAKHDPESEEAAAAKVPKESRLGEIVLCFSIYTNTAELFSTKLMDQVIPSIHGLRCLGMMWIIMVHTILYEIEYMDNKVMALRLSEGVIQQIISNAVFSVDTFFFLSGFLLSYIYLGANEKKKETKPINILAKISDFFLMLVKRLSRILPTYLFLIGLLDLNTTYYGIQSMFYMFERPQEQCPKYWWRNLLFINNLFDKEEMCMSWSWYIACDTQFFVVGSILLLFSGLYYSAVVTIMCLLTILSIVFSGYMSYVYELVPTLDELYRLTTEMYNAPWMRIGPYMVGIGTGILLQKYKSKLNFKRRTVAVCWILGASCNLLILFGLAQRHISVTASAFYSALARTMWGVGIAWIIVACYTNNAGFVNTILSFKGWIAMSKLTYTAYLLNPLLIGSVYLNNESAAHIDYLPTGTSFLGMIIVTYVCSYVISLCTEIPYNLLMRKYMRSRSRKK